MPEEDPEDAVAFSVTADLTPFLEAIKTLEPEIRRVTRTMADDVNQVSDETATTWAELANKIAGSFSEVNKAVGADLAAVSATILRSMGLTFSQIYQVISSLKDQGSAAIRSVEEQNAKLDAAEEARARSGKERFEQRQAHAEALAQAVLQEKVASESEVEYQKRLEMALNQTTTAMDLYIARAKILKDLQMTVIEAQQKAEAGQSPSTINKQYGPALEQSAALTGTKNLDLTAEGLDKLQMKMNNMIMLAERLGSKLEVSSEGFLAQLKNIDATLGEGSIGSAAIDRLVVELDLAQAKLKALQAASPFPQQQAQIEAATLEVGKYEAALASIVTVSFGPFLQQSFGKPEDLSIRASTVGGDLSKKVDGIRENVLRQILDSLTGDADSYFKLAGMDFAGKDSPASNWGKEFEKKMQGFLLDMGQASIGEFSQRMEGLIGGFRVTGEADWLPAGQKFVADFKAVNLDIRKQLESYVKMAEEIGPDAAYDAMKGQGASQAQNYITQLSQYGLLKQRESGRIIFGAPIGGSESPTTAAQEASSNLGNASVNFPLLSEGRVIGEVAAASKVYKDMLTDPEVLVIIRDAVLKTSQLAAEEMKSAQARRENLALAKEILAEEERVTAEKKAQASASATTTGPTITATTSQVVNSQVTQQRVSAEKDLATATSVLTELENKAFAVKTARDRAAKEVTDDNTRVNQQNLRTQEEVLSKAQQQVIIQTQLVNGLNVKVQALREEERVLTNVAALESRRVPQSKEDVAVDLVLDREAYDLAVRTAQVKEQDAARAKQQWREAQSELQQYGDLLRSGGATGGAGTQLRSSGLDANGRLISSYVSGDTASAKAQSDALVRQVNTTKELYQTAKAGADEATAAVKRYDAQLDTTTATMSLMKRNEALGGSGADSADVQAVNAKVAAFKEQATAVEGNTEAMKKLRQEIKEYIRDLDETIRANRLAQGTTNSAGLNQAAQQAQAELRLAQQNYNAAMTGAGQTNTAEGTAQYLAQAEAISQTLGPLRAKAQAATDDAEAAKLEATALQNTNREMVTARGNLNGMQQGLQQTDGATKTWLDRLLSVQKVVTIAVGALLSQFIYGLMGQVQSAIADVIKNASDLDTAVHNLSANLLGAQKAFGQVVGTTQQWQKAVIDLRNEFKIFSLADWNKAAADGIQVGAEYGLSFQQLQQVMTAAGSIAAKNGLDLANTVQLVARASREGLRGLNDYIGKIDETIDLDTRSHDMYGQRFKDLSAEEQQMVRLAEVYDRATRAAGELNDTLSSQNNLVKEQDATRKDLTADIGKNALPIINFFNSLQTTAVKVMDMLLRPKWIEDWINGVIGIQSTVTGLAILLRLLPEVAKGAISIKDALHASQQGFDQEKAYLTEQYNVKALHSDNIVSNYTGTPTEPKVEPGAPTPDAMDELFKELEKIQADYHKAGKAAWDKYNAAIDAAEKAHMTTMGEIDQTWRDAQAKAWDTYYKANADAMKKAAESAAQADKQYNAQRSQNEAAYNKEKNRAQEDYDLGAAKDKQKFDANEADQLAKHYDDLKKIQQKYLFELEDAIQQRDARAVLKALRNMNQDIADSNKQYNQGKTDRQKAFDAEQADKAAKFALDQARRLEDYNQQQQQLKDAYVAQLIEIQKNLDAQLIANQVARDADLKSSDADRKKAMDDENRQYNVLKMQIDAQYQKDLAAAKIARDNEVAVFTDGWVKKYNVTVAWAKSIYDVIKAYFGPGGAVEALYAAMIAGINTPTPEPQVPAPPTAPSGGGGSGGNVGSGPITRRNADGGSWITNGPELALFGEGADPHELVTATPLSKIGIGGTGNVPTSKHILNVNVTADQHFGAEIEDRVIGQIIEAVKELTVVKGANR